MKPPRLDGFDPNYKSHSQIKPESVHLKSVALIENNKNTPTPLSSSTETIKTNPTKTLERILETKPIPSPSLVEPINENQENNDKSVMRKSGAYFTEQETRKIEDLFYLISRKFRGESEIRVRKNDIVRACLNIGLENQNLIEKKLSDLLKK
jgi:hypothetical protein